MSTERPFVASFRNSLWSLILYFFFSWFNTYIGKYLMSTETSCHFGHLLLVSNHRRHWFLKNPLFYLFPIQKHKGPNLTFRKISQAQPRVIIWTNLVVLKHPMLHNKFQGHRPFGSGEEDFLRFSLYMGMAAILVMWPGPFEKNFRSPIPWRLHMTFGLNRPSCICGEDFLECGRQTDGQTDRQTTEAYLFFKLTNEPSAQVS